VSGTNPEATIRTISQNNNETPDDQFKEGCHLGSCTTKNIKRTTQRDSQADAKTQGKPGTSNVHTSQKQQISKAKSNAK
jgi:hypothetical protein